MVVANNIIRICGIQAELSSNQGVFGNENSLNWLLLIRSSHKTISEWNSCSKVHFEESPTLWRMQVVYASKELFLMPGHTIQIHDTGIICLVNLAEVDFNLSKMTRQGTSLCRGPLLQCQVSGVPISTCALPSQMMVSHHISWCTECKFNSTRCLAWPCVSSFGAMFPSITLSLWINGLQPIEDILLCFEMEGVWSLGQWTEVPLGGNEWCLPDNRYSGLPRMDVPCKEGFSPLVHVKGKHPVLCLWEPVA